MMNIIITEEEIKNNPNYFELGKLVSEKYWKNKTVNSYNTFVSDDGFDLCVVCGKKSPYFKIENIENRIGYVEGAGQGCFQPNKCENTNHE